MVKGTGRAAFVCAALLSYSAYAASNKRAVSLDDLVTMRWPESVQISPDGRWVAYELITPDLENNRLDLDLYVVASNGSKAPRRLTSVSLPAKKHANPGKPLWSPDSKTLGYAFPGDRRHSVQRIELASGKQSILFDANDLDENVSVDADTLIFSPDGRKLAFVSFETEPATERPKMLRAMEVDDPRWTPTLEAPTFRRIWVIDLIARRAQPITDRSLNVSGVSWSPDGRRLALEASREFTSASYMRKDIYLVDADGQNLQALVTQDGRDRYPVWSPNGRQIAFATQHGTENWMRGDTVAIVDVDARSPPRLIGEALESMSGAEVDEPHWSTNGEALLVATGYRMTKQLFSVDVRDGRTARLTPREDLHYGSSNFDDVGFSYSQDGKLAAAIVESVGIPPEVYVFRTRDMEGHPLTQLNPEWSSLSVPRSEVVEWASRDGRWTIRGLLLKPSDYRRDRRYPLLVNNVGGPGMVSRLTNPSFNYPVLAQAEAGYLVLSPNTRGRGGYGPDFHRALGAERDYVLGPAQDVLAGVDAMVERGIADPKAIGIFGFSYGEALTMQVLVESDRFRAAAVGDGHPGLLAFFHGYDILPNGGYHLGLYRDMFGVSNWFEPEEISRLFQQTPMFFLSRVNTPVLIESGELSAWPPNQQLLAGLQHFGIPVEHNVYPRSTHGWEEPLLIQDSYRRQISWFDYWIRNKPYSNAEKQKTYDAWKRQTTLQYSWLSSLLLQRARQELF